MEDARSCSTKWPRYSLYVYTGLSILVGGGLVGGGVYFLKKTGGFKTLFSATLQEILYDNVDLIQLIYLAAIIVGVSLILASISLGICGAYRMNRSCVAAYAVFLLLGFAALVAVGLTVTAYEPKFLEAVNKRSTTKSNDIKTLEQFTRFMIICSLSVATFLLVGVTLTCCMQKAIEDVLKAAG